MMMVHQPTDRTAVARSAALVIGSGSGTVMARDAVEAAGAVVVATASWDEAVRAIERHGADAVCLVEAEGADAARLAVSLPRIDSAAAALAMPVIVALDEAAIDVVAASMVDSGAELLCAPSVAERVVSLAIALDRTGALIAADSVREGEAARLQRLNEEVARIADVLSKLTRREPERSPLPAVAEHPSPFRHAEGDEGIVIAAAEVRRVIRARRMRDQVFGSGLFEDPAWEILLDLFAAELERVQVSVSSLCIAAAVAPTTALRWIAKLTEAGLLERHPDPFDRRRAFMELSPGASRTMRELVASLRRAGLPFA